MLQLPGKTEKKDNKIRLEEEIGRQLAIMEKNDPESPEYKFAFNNYKELHQEQLAEDKLTEQRKARWFEGITTGLLAVTTMTVEYWSPITSRWGQSFMKPFRRNKTL